MFSLIKHRPERAMVRRNPFWPLREEFENVFNRFVEAMPFPEWAEMREWETEEKENEVVMRLELPGFEPKELELHVEGNEFVVTAEHPESTEEKEKVERRHMERFVSRFVMPFGTDVNRIEAMYRNGVLELHLPRLAEAKPKRIEVKT
jgi:HSP20 family protein